LKEWYAATTDVYVSGSLLIYYAQGDKRRHVAPDVFVVKGVPNHKRPYYLLWEEGKGPDVAIELSSKSTRREDLNKKFQLYQDVLMVQEYFLFGPFEEYLKPSMQGYRLLEGRYQPIQWVDGRLPSEVLKLHLQRAGQMLRFHDPARGKGLPTPHEKLALEQAARQRAEAKVHELHRQLEALRRSREP